MAAPKGESPADEISAEDPAPFPDSDADVLREQAAYLDTLAAAGAIVQLAPLLTLPGAISAGAAVSDGMEQFIEEVFDDIQQLLGDYTAVRDLAFDLAELSMEPMSIREDLRDQADVLADYWKGDSYDAFTKHVDQVNEAFKDTHAKMVSIAKALAGAISTVFGTWSSAISFLSECAIAVVGVWNPDTLIDGFKSFLTSLKNLIDGAIDTIGSYVEELTNLQVDAITFPTLPENEKKLESAGDTDEWEVKPAPGT